MRITNNKVGKNMIFSDIGAIIAATMIARGKAVQNVEIICMNAAKEHALAE